MVVHVWHTNPLFFLTYFKRIHFPLSVFNGTHHRCTWKAGLQLVHLSLSVSNSWFCNTLLKGVCAWWCSYHIPATSYVVCPRDCPHFMQVFVRQNDCYPKTFITVGLLKIKEKTLTYVDRCLSCISFGPSVGDNTFGSSPPTSGKLHTQCCSCLNVHVWENRRVWASRWVECASP